MYMLQVASRRNCILFASYYVYEIEFYKLRERYMHNAKKQESGAVHVIICKLFGQTIFILGRECAQL